MYRYIFDSWIQNYRCGWQLLINNILKWHSSQSMYVNEESLIKISQTFFIFLFLFHFLIWHISHIRIISAFHIFCSFHPMPFKHFSRIPYRFFLLCYQQPHSSHLTIQAQIHHSHSGVLCNIHSIGDEKEKKTEEISNFSKIMQKPATKKHILVHNGMVFLKLCMKYGPD